jgi:hypothetical protein
MSCVFPKYFGGKLICTLVRNRLQLAYIYYFKSKRKFHK